MSLDSKEKLWVAVCHVSLPFTNAVPAGSSADAALTQHSSGTMAPTDVPTRELYIGGKWLAPQSNKRLPVICPFTEEQIGTIPAGGAPEVKAAVSAATKAFYNGSWSKLTGAERASYLRKIAEKVRHKRHSLNFRYCSAPEYSDDSNSV